MAGAPSERPDTMHFHIRGICKSCLHVELYRTHLPDVLIAGDLCRRCFAPDVVGLDDDTDRPCERCDPSYTRRLMDRWVHQQGGWP